MSKSVNNRITGPAIDAFQMLPGRFRIEIIDYLQQAPHRELRSKQDLIEAWFHYHGIYGYASDAVQLILTVHEAK